MISAVLVGLAIWVFIADLFLPLGSGQLLTWVVSAIKRRQTPTTNGIPS